MPFWKDLPDYQRNNRQEFCREKGRLHSGGEKSGICCLPVRNLHRQNNEPFEEPYSLPLVGYGNLLLHILPFSGPAQMFSIHEAHAYISVSGADLRRASLSTQEAHAYIRTFPDKEDGRTRTFQNLLYAQISMHDGPWRKRIWGPLIFHQKKFHRECGNPYFMGKTW